jgi:hypothetical protein
MHKLSDIYEHLIRGWRLYTQQMNIYTNINTKNSGRSYQKKITYYFDRITKKKKKNFNLYKKLLVF